VALNLSTITRQLSSENDLLLGIFFVGISSFPMPPQRTITSSKEGKVRQRSSRACQPCRKRKIKCDGKDPCEACVGYGYECTYTERQASKGPTIVAAQPSAKDVAAIETLPGPKPISNEDRTIASSAPYMATESVVAESETEPFLLQSLKTRFTSAHSAIAWPKALGTSLEMPTPPRLQSYAWNPGHRSEPKVIPQNNICNIITLEDVKFFSDVFFNVVNPVFGIVDRNMYMKRSTEFW
jgi:hypothetical protein